MNEEAVARVGLLLQVRFGERGGGGGEGEDF
jgi:hypothetical protein